MLLLVQEERDNKGKDKMSKVNFAKINDYADELGRQIRVYSPQGNFEHPKVKEDSLEAKTLFRGMKMVTVQRNKNSQPEQIPFEFFFPEQIKDVKQAFEKFDSIMDVEFKKAKDEAQKKLEMAERERAMQLTGPDGKPLIFPTR